MTSGGRSHLEVIRSELQGARSAGVVQGAMGISNGVAPEA